MPIFNAKQKAKAQAEELAKSYTIKYNPDGETFSIYAKNDASGKKHGTDLMVDADKRFPNLSRKKHLTTEYYQKLAEQQDLEALKAAADKKAADYLLLQKQLADGLNKNKDKTITTDNGAVNLNTVLDANKLKFDADNLDMTLDVIGPNKYTKPIYKTTTENINENNKTIKGYIPKESVYDITTKNPVKELASVVYPWINEPSLADFTKAKKENKTHIVSYNDVYDVDENLNEYNKKKDKWSPLPSNKFYRDVMWNAERPSGTPGLIQGEKEKGFAGKLWEKYGPFTQNSSASYQGRPGSLFEDFLPITDKAKTALSTFSFLNKAKFTPEITNTSKALYTNKSLAPNMIKSLPLNTIKSLPESVLRVLPKNMLKSIEQVSKVADNRPWISSTLKPFTEYIAPGSNFKLPMPLKYMPGMKTGGKLIPRQ